MTGQSGFLCAATRTVISTDSGALKDGPAADLGTKIIENAMSRARRGFAATLFCAAAWGGAALAQTGLPGMLYDIAV